MTLTDDAVQGIGNRDSLDLKAGKYRKRVVLAVCTGWMGSEMMASCRKQRVLVGYRYGLHVGDGVLMSVG